MSVFMYHFLYSAHALGTLIHGLIFSNVINHFQGLLETNKAYMIYNPFVKAINSFYENVHSSFELTFQRGTVVTELPEKLQISQLNLAFKRFSEITPQLNEKENQHVIGVLKIVMPLTDFAKTEGNIGYKRDIVLLDVTTLETIDINLWDDLALNEGQIMKSMESDHPIISLSNLRMQEYNRVYQLKSTQTTAIFFNPPCPETDVANLWLNVGNKRKELNTIWMKKLLIETQCVTIEEIVRNRTSLLENTYYYLRGTVKEIENILLPYYEACDHCFKTATKTPNGFTCMNCLKVKVKIVPRYKLTFLVEDKTNIARITMFEKHVEALFGYPVEDFIKMQNQLAPARKTKDPFVDLLKENYKLLFKLNHLVDTRGTICSIIAEGVEKIADTLNKGTESGKRRLRKKNKVENQDLIIEEEKNTTASAKQLANDTKGKKKLIEVDDNEILSDYLKRIRPNDAKKTKILIDKVDIKQEK